VTPGVLRADERARRTSDDRKGKSRDDAQPRPSPPRRVGPRRMRPARSRRHTLPFAVPSAGRPNLASASVSIIRTRGLPWPYRASIIGGWSSLTGSAKATSHPTCDASIAGSNAKPSPTRARDARRRRPASLARPAGGRSRRGLFGCDSIWGSRLWSRQLRDRRPEHHKVPSCEAAAVRPDDDHDTDPGLRLHRRWWAHNLQRLRVRHLGVQGVSHQFRHGSRRGAAAELLRSSGRGRTDPCFYGQDVAFDCHQCSATDPFCLCAESSWDECSTK
jgi:hypothetical protein